VTYTPSPLVGRGRGEGEGALHGSVDALLQAAVDAGEVPGVAAVAVDRHGVIYAGGFGRRVVDEPARMTTDTVVWIASMTKAVTAAAAMQLVECGKVDLDGPVARWVPDLARTQVLTGWDNDGQPCLRPPRRPISLRHLLTHTAGFSYDLFSADLVRYHALKGIPRVGSGRNVALTSPLLFDPGERWQYGIGIDWTGKLIEAVTGSKLGQYMRKNVLDPLGMDSTAFKITPGMRERLAKVHQRRVDGSCEPLDLEVPQEPEFEVGGGGLYSTAEDYVKFVRVFLDGGAGNGNRILDPQTVDLMSRNAMGKIKVTMQHSQLPDLTNDAEFFPGMPKGWGLSFMINEQTAPTGRSAGSLGWGGLANTYYWIDRSKGVAGVYVTQLLPFADVKALPLFHAFEEAVYRSIGQPGYSE
jgi:methyl acetate hydrolase